MARQPKAELLQLQKQLDESQSRLAELEALLDGTAFMKYEYLTDSERLNLEEDIQPAFDKDLYNKIMTTYSGTELSDIVNSL